MAQRESLRAEAGRTGRTLYEVRLERGRAEARARGEEPPSAREALGHYRPNQAVPKAHISAVLANPERSSYVEVDIPTARRIGKHSELARLLSAGGDYRGRPITPARFQRLVSRWAPVEVLGGDEQSGHYRLLADADAVIALLDVQRISGTPAFRYARAPR